MGYPGRTFPREFVKEALDTIEKKIHIQYAEKHREIVKKIMVLDSIISNKEIWWNKVSGLAATKENSTIFLRNMERNFGVNSIGYDLIGSVENRKKRMQEIVDAIMTYSDGRKAWEDALSKMRIGAREKSSS